MEPVTSHRLYVLRHAKSSWDDPKLADHERPLAPRGRRAAEALGEYLGREGLRPTLVLCSPARRARETYDLVRPGGGVLVEQGLYGASPGALIGRLREIEEGVDSLMVVGHNPTLQSVVMELAEGPDDLLGAVGHKFPTCALATLAFSCPWSEVARDRGRLIAFMRPADLRP